MRDVYRAALQRVRLWCKVDEEGCWEWHGCRSGLGVPRIWFAGRACTVRRVVMQAKLGRPLKRGKYCIADCGNRDCVSPDCLRAVTRSEYARLAELRNPMLSVKRLLSRRRRSVLRVDQVREIRLRSALGETDRQIARDYGVTHSTVYRIKRRLIWRNDDPLAL